MRTKIFFLAMILTSCGASKVDDDSSTEGRVTFLLQLDATRQTYVRCVPANGEIQCDPASRDTLPATSTFSAVTNFTGWQGLDLLNEEDGCYADYRGPHEGQSLGDVNTLIELKNDSVCRPVFRITDSEGKIREEFRAGTNSVNFLADVSFLKNLSLRMTNVNGGACALTYRYTGTKGVETKQLNIVDADISFSSLFSLHWDQSMHEAGQYVQKSNFTYFHTPAIDTAPFVAQGMTTNDVIAKLTPHLGTALIIEGNDPYGHRVSCKHKDSVYGSTPIALEKMNKSVGFKMARKLLIRKEVSDNVELAVLVNVAEYTDMLDSGAVAGGLSVQVLE